MDDEDDDLTVGEDIVLFGFVGDSFMDEGFTAKQVLRALAASDGADVTLRLNSGGGYAPEGAAIHAALRGYKGRVTVRVEGIAASAASLIAMGGDEIVMAPGALMMIHDPSAMTIGTASDHIKSAADLDKLAATYAEIYAARSGKDGAEVRALMLAETWMNGAEAVEMGFADRVDGGDKAALAAFDFSIYAHAPEPLRALAKARGWRFQPELAGSPATSRKQEPVMAATKEAVVEATAAPAAKPEMKVEDVAAKAVAAERERIVSIRQAAVKMRVGDDVADKLIADGASVADAHALLIDAWAAKGDRHEYGARPAEPKADRLDERETMRAGMVEAMAAHMRCGDATERARPFMGLRSIPAMAAAYLGDRRPLDTFSARQEILMAAFHTTSDFPALLENVLNKGLVARYLEAQPTYRRVARQVSFADFRPHPMVKMGDFPEMSEIAENGEIKFGTFGDAKETVAVKSYGVGASLSRQAMINDTLGGIDQALADRGRAVARFEDKTFYTMLVSGSGSDGPTLSETSRQVFNTTDKTKASANAAITVSSVALGRAAMRKQTSVGGDALLDVSAAIILVGPDKELEAQQLVAPIQAQQASNINPFSGTLQVVTTARLTGNVWYLFADPADVPCFVYGFLDGFAAPRVRIDEPFGMQGLKMTIEHDFGVGAIDFRGGYKNAGA